MSLENGHGHLEVKLPTRKELAVFRFKATCFQLRRLASDTWRGLKRHRRGGTLADAKITAEWSSALWSDASLPQERRLQLGKVQNLRAGVRLLDGIEVHAGEVFSFWKQIGRATKRRGFAEGRELREGCLIPTIGGGLCQLSGALYNAALEAGLEIVERHAHSQRSVGTLAQLGRDATVFWNYVDLRFRADFDWRLEAANDQTRLTVRIRADQKPASKAGITTLPTAAPITSASPNSCHACGVTECIRHVAPESRSVDRVAVLVDEWWPEWDQFLRTVTRPDWLLCRPLDGILFRKPNYRWNSKSFGEVTSATVLTLRRAWATRRLRAQGAARQRALLHWDARLAAHYSRRLRAEHSHLIISQNLLPFLWREGVLGGRTYDVLMTRLPMHELHAQLDLAARLHPDSGTCADFRAPADLVHAEAEALEQASRWITPHSFVAKLAGCKAHQLPWVVPNRSHGASSRPSGPILFPASTLCRKGAYELRAVVRELKCEIAFTGGLLEGADFWQGLKVRQFAGSLSESVGAIVLPAFVENQPRKLLNAVACGIPVIASTACGLGAVLGVREIPPGDVAALEGVMRATLSENATAQLHC